MLRAGLVIAAIMALAVFVAWPYQQRISAAITQPTVTADEFLPGAAVMLFDTSLSNMQYKHESKTRLEVAQEIAAKHIGSMPHLSRVAVCDTAGEPQIRFSTDLPGAAKRISGLSVHMTNRPLDDRILSALEAQVADYEQTSSREGAAAGEKGKEEVLREVYVFHRSGRRAARRKRRLFADARSPRKRCAARRQRLPDRTSGVVSPTNVAVSELVPRRTDAAGGKSARFTGRDHGHGIRRPRQSNATSSCSSKVHQEGSSRKSRRRSRSIRRRRRRLTSRLGFRPAR